MTTPMMANTASDRELAQLLEEPPRKRRAAALAAQKNWQLLEVDDNPTDDDIIIVEHRQAINTSANTSHVNNNHNNTTVLPAQRPGPASKKLQYIAQPQVITFNTSSGRSVRSPIVFGGTAGANIRVNQFVINPLTYSNNAVNAVKATRSQAQQQSRVNAQPMVRIETENSSRLIPQTPSGQSFKKPVVTKLHANEPIVWPVVDGDVEEIVGTYDVLEEDLNLKLTSEETVNNLDLELFCGPDVDDKEKTSTEKDSDIEVVEETVNGSAPTTPKSTPQKKIIPKNKKPIDGHLESVIGSLEMDCENFDDDYTDGVCCECEEDILNFNQWNRSVASKKEFNAYKSSVVSTKNVKYLRESEVTEPLGSVTVVVSETSRVVTTTPKPPAVVRMPRSRPNVQTSQSIRNPIPSAGIRHNTPRAPNQYQYRQQSPAQSPMVTSHPITLVPSTSMGTTQPLIIAPMASNLMGTSLLQNGMQVILTPGQGSNQPTFLIPASTIYSSNTQNYITTHTNQTIQLFNQSRPVQTVIPQVRNTYSVGRPQRIRAPMQPIYRAGGPPTAYRTPAPQPTAFRSPAVSRTPNTGFRTPAPNTGYRTLAPNAGYRTPAPNTGYRTVAPNTAYRTAGPRQVLITQYPMGSPNTPTYIQTNSRLTITKLLECMTILTTQPTKKINMRTILTIKPLPFSWPSVIDDLIASLIKLDNALMKEKFKESPIAWMVTSHLIVPPKCQSCNKGICNQVNKTQSTKYEYWNCNFSKCNASRVIDRPPIFSGPKFDMPASKLLFIIYYWSIQVDVEDLIKTGQIEMGTEKIFNVWQQLQRVCSFALRTKDSTLGTKTKDVEIASVRLSNFMILGAMETYTNRVKFSVVTLSHITETEGKQLIIEPFVKWITRGTTVKTCESKFLALKEYGFNVVLVPKSVFMAQAINTPGLKSISGYMTHHLQKFFKDFELSSLTDSLLQNILDELLWRERYGSNPFTAFYSIIKHISEQCGLQKYDSLPLSATFGTPPPARPPPSNLQTYSGANRQPNRLLNPIQPLNETNSVFVDEYYYSSTQLKKEFAKNDAPEEELAKDSLQCHLCQMFFNNILIIKHLVEHLEVERGGRVRKGDNNETECKHCLRFFNNRTLHMHEELTSLKVIPYSCRLCIVPFYARQPFIQHMKTSHYAGEMPYYCDICSYRSSFQKNLLDHFEAKHSNTSQLMCPFCIRVFHLSKYKNLSQFVYRHLQTHYAIASVYDCDKCVLTFISKPDLKEHCFKGHNPSAAVDEKFEIETFVVQEEDRQLCVRAREEELFTPFLPTFANNGLMPLIDSNTATTDDNENNFEISCMPNISDFLSMEPECHLSLNEDNMPFENFILPVDCDYSEKQLTQMLSASFPLKPNSVDVEEGVKTEILFNDKTTVCFECNTNLTISHYNSKSVCEKCNFTTHCSTAFAEHTAGAHSTPKQLVNENTVHRLYPQFVTYDVRCGDSDCNFTATDGNQMAIHMIKENHFISICKPLHETTQQLGNDLQQNLDNDLTQESAPDLAQEMPQEVTEQSTEETTDKENDNKSDNKSVVKIEKEVEEKTDERVDEKINERVDERDEQKVDEMSERVDERVEETTD